MLQIPLGTLHLGAFMKGTFILILWLKCHSPSWQGGIMQECEVALIASVDRKQTKK